MDTKTMIELLAEMESSRDAMEKAQESGDQAAFTLAQSSHMQATAIAFAYAAEAAKSLRAHLVRVTERLKYSADIVDTEAAEAVELTAWVEK